VERWRGRLTAGGTLSEAESLSMLGDFGITVSQSVSASSEQQVVAAAGELGYPVVLKSAKEGLLHKSDQGGVVLGIDDAPLLRQMYRLMAARLGADVLLAPMAPTGVEMFLGVKRDPQFGPVVLLGFGGVLAETVGDVQFALPPFDAAHARRCVDRMTLRPLLDGVRGAAPVDVDAFCEAAARFSSLVHALGDVLAEVDVNPVIVHQNGAIAVDALVVAG
jgi:succinyl-CoA synthetase beta subunit